MKSNSKENSFALIDLGDTMFQELQSDLPSSGKSYYNQVHGGQNQVHGGQNQVHGGQNQVHGGQNQVHGGQNQVQGGQNPLNNQSHTGNYNGVSEGNFNYSYLSLLLASSEQSEHLRRFRPDEGYIIEVFIFNHLL